MSNKKSLEEVNIEIENTKTQIKQNENHIKRLQQQVKTEERKARTKRLIERGAILESLIPEAVSLSNEEIKTLLANALASRENLTVSRT